MAIASAQSGAQYETKHGMTLSAVASELGITVGEVWRAERRALKKLRKLPEARAMLRMARGEANLEDGDAAQR